MSRARLFLDKHFHSAHSLTVKQTKEKSEAILWIEAFGFSFLIAGSWLTEFVKIPHLLFGELFMADWRRALLRSLVISLVWFWVHQATKRLLKRLHYLEEFLRVCGWCRKVCHDDEWLTMEQYFNSQFATKTSHGMCPDCLREKVEELAAKEKKSGEKKLQTTV